MAPADHSLRRDQGCDVYFCYGHAANSFNGLLDDNESINEEEVQSYIKCSNPALYERLHRMPFTSADIPLGLDAQRRLKRTREIEQSLGRHGYKAAEQIVEEKSAEQIDVQPTCHLDVLVKQFKRYVQACLLNGHVLILKKHPSICSPLTCDSPVCSYGRLVHPGTFYLILRPSYFRVNQTNLVGPLNHTYYTLQCLEDLFSGDPNSESEIVNQVADTSLDGVGRGLVFEAANRFYKIHEEAVAKKECEMAPASFDCDGSGQHQKIQSRIKKRNEIESALIEVGKYERRRSSSEESADHLTPDLHITRPSYMEAPRDRYKKQGLGPYDKRLATHEERKHKSLHSRVSPTSETSDQSVDPQCYCREPSLDEDCMIKCSNDWCPIGWFHLRCTDLRSLSVTGDKFLCNYCRDDCGPFKPLAVDKERRRVSDTGSAMTQDSSEIQTSGPSTGEDSWDTYSDREQPGEEDVAVVIKLSKWGTPINLQAGGDAVSEPTHDNEQIPFSPEAQSSRQLGHHSQTDGFTAINSPGGFVDPDQLEFVSQHTTTPQTIQLPTESSLPKFADFAPHIFAEGLSESETQVFEAWKKHKTTSSTADLYDLEFSGAFALYGVSEDGETFDTALMSLSSLLHSIKKSVI